MNRLDQLLAFHLEDPNDSFIRFALAAEYRKLGQLEKALKSFEDLMAKDPDYVGLYFHLGKTLEATLQVDRAKEIYREGIRRAGILRDFHARAELLSALLEAVGFDE